MGFQAARENNTHLRSSILKRYADWRIGAWTQEKKIYKTTESILFTFDDYGTKRQVVRLLDILAREDIQAMFFVQGDWAEARPDLVQLIVDHGHIIGNHTYSHQDLLKLSDHEVVEEIERGPVSPWLRPPMGRYDSRIRKIAATMKRYIAYWSIDSDDWQGVTPEYMSRKILRELHPGAVILFHIHADNTARVLPGLIRDIRRRGYNICSFDEPLPEPRDVAHA